MPPKPKLFHSYTARLALLYALIFSASTLFLFSFFYLFTVSIMAQQLDNAIETEIQGLAERYDQNGLPGLTALIAERIRRQRARAAGNSIYLLTTATFKPLVGNLDRWPRRAKIDDEWIEFALALHRDNNQTRLARARIFRLPGRYGLLVGRDIHQLTVAKRRIVQALIWGLAFMVLLAFGGGLILSRRTVRKIERINQTARRIMQGDMTRRVPLSGNNDDFDQVAANLNQMLDRIQSLMEDIRRVSDGVAHDLRTPLARLRQHLEQARQQHSPDSATAQRLENSIREADALLSTFNALLRIARIESGQINSGFGVVDFERLLRDVIEFYEPLAEEKQQRLSTAYTPGIVVRGDRDLLFQAAANLVDNAIKYTPPRGHIRIALTRADATAELRIADNGPGIPAAERKKVFRRFYRLDQSRGSSGNGLGLSLVAAVVAMHNGRVALTGDGNGLRAVVKLPSMQAANAADHTRISNASPAAE